MTEHQPLNRNAEMRNVVGPTMALVLGALILIGSGRVEAQASPAAEGGYSDASLSGTYLSWTTFKAYVKFAGGPRIASGEIQFDGRGAGSPATELISIRSWRAC